MARDNNAVVYEF